MMTTPIYDIAIIGSGVIGSSAARLLTLKGYRVAVLEAGSDIAMGTSKANSAIVHAGFDCKPGSLMAKLNVRGNEIFEDWCKKLDVPFQRVGALVAAFAEDEEPVLDRLLENARANKVPGAEIISGDKAREIEPLLSDKATKALWAPSSAITCPYEFTIACAENAKKNGAEFIFNSKIVSVDADGSCFILTTADKRIFKAKNVINAAGIYSDDVSAMVGDIDFKIVPRKGEYLLLDRSAAHFSTVVFQTPSKMGKGVLVAPTVDGNSFAGPTAVDQEDKTDTSVTPEGIASLKLLAAKSAPSMDFRKTITLFAGLRAQAVPLAPTAPEHDFIIRAHRKNAGVFTEAAGICSPGLSSAPAIAEYITALLEENGAAPSGEAGGDPTRQAIPAFRHMTDEERKAAIEKNPLYGRIVCRCETITEAEIVEAIHRGATTVDGVKRRTRAGMGRCQGGFCSPKVMEIIARERGVPITSITKFGTGSEISPWRTREGMENQ